MPVTAPSKAAFNFQPSSPTTLLPTEEPGDFTRNFRQLEKSFKRPYSVTKVIRELCSGGVKDFEAEVGDELKLLAGSRRDVNGCLVPIEALSRDLAAGTPNLGGALVQTTVGKEVVPFLRYKSVTGRLGATLVSDLAPGTWKLPRATGSAGAVWQPETGGTTPTDSAFDQVTLAPSRISGGTNISSWLVKQSSPDIEKFVIGDLTDSIATAVDAAVLNGSGVSPVPLGILNLPVNAAGVYNYASRSPNVTFAGPATWASVLKFEDTIDSGAQVHNLDGSYGWCAAGDVRVKWMTVPQMAASNFPRYLWEQPDDDPFFGRVAGRKAVSTSQMPVGKIIFGRWSDVIVGSWTAIEIVTDPYSLASNGQIAIRANLLTAIAFRYASAFVTSSDSAAQ
jgi:hypothetical protein